MSEGKVLQQLFVSGVPDKGEALVEYVDLARSARQEAAGYLARDPVPLEAEKMVKQYFDTLETPAPKP
jgi:hypothetical protein